MLLTEARANLSELVVNAVAERLQVTGFRFGSSEDSAAAWAIWQANQMDADAEMVQTDALVQGSSFVLVQPDEELTPWACPSRLSQPSRRVSCTSQAAATAAAPVTSGGLMRPPRAARRS